MKKKQVWRYYCEFCKKSGCSAPHIKRHESGCTANPDRKCAMHQFVEGTQRPMAELINALTSCGTDFDAGLEKLKELADDCPACILAAIRQSKVQTPDEYDKQDDTFISGVHINFNFKEALKEMWSQHNNAEYDRECRSIL